jgi:hypothetical protein
MEEARTAVGDTKALCDIITAHGLDPLIRYQFENWERNRASVQKHPARHRALKALGNLTAFHFPIAFPEVFLRRGGGFDVIVVGAAFYMRTLRAAVIEIDVNVAPKMSERTADHS